MSITQFKNTATLELEESNPVAVPLGEPVAVTSVTSVERSDGVETGIWECTPGRWRLSIPRDELCHFLEGDATYRHDNGEVIEIRPHTLVLFPAGWTGECEVRETLRNTYMLV